MCLAYIVTCVHSLQVVVLLCTLLYSSTVLLSTVVQYLYFKPRMSRSKCKSSSDVAGMVLPRHHWIVFFKRVDRIESSKEPEPVPSTSGTSEIAACPPPPIADDPSALPSHLLSLLQSITLLACSLDASPCMPAVVLYYCTFQGTVL